MKRNLLFGLLALLVIGLFISGDYAYQNRPKVIPKTPTNVPVAQYKELADQMKLHDLVNSQNLAQATSRTNSVIAQRTALCTALSVHKVAVSPDLCK